MNLPSCLNILKNRDDKTGSFVLLRVEFWPVKLPTWMLVICYVWQRLDKPIIALDLYRWYINSFWVCDYKLLNNCIR